LARSPLPPLICYTRFTPVPTQTPNQREFQRIPFFHRFPFPTPHENPFPVTGRTPFPFSAPPDPRMEEAMRNIPLPDQPAESLPRLACFSLHRVLRAPQGVFSPPLSFLKPFFSLTFELPCGPTPKPGKCGAVPPPRSLTNLQPIMRLPPFHAVFVVRDIILETPFSGRVPEGLGYPQYGMPHKYELWRPA